MDGQNPGDVAKNILTLLGGATGGYILACCLMVTLMLVAAGIVNKHQATVVTVIGVLAWGSVWIVRAAIGWA